MKTVIIEVMFRKFKDGQIIAIFPYETNRLGYCLSYMHVGQHSDCSTEIRHDTKPATPNEAQPLLKELRSIYTPEDGKEYTFKVIKRMQIYKHVQAVEKRGEK